MGCTTRLIAIAFTLFLSADSFSQKGYLKPIIVNGDTKTRHSPNQVYWSLKDYITDYIIESKLNSASLKSDSKYPVVGRTYEGYIVSGLNISDFTIRFHTGKNTVTYIYPNKTIVYKGKYIQFNL